MAGVSDPTFWQSKYDGGEAAWDLGGPTPVFMHLYDTKRLTPGAMLVPGSGRGYDPVFFAKHGFDVTAVDFAATAVEATRANAAQAGVALTVLQDDIFTLGAKLPRWFDYVLEYTCMCAIDVGRRAEYAQVIADVLKPGGLLIGLFFPIDGRTGGPPFAVSEEELLALFEKNFTLVSSEFRDDSIAPRRGKEKLIILKRK